ncbi:MAG TPA: response regulator transcription factor [Bacteroidales bacterium]|nr:response regulator transcription factor [Bacteroidales bacterium]
MKLLVVEDDNLLCKSITDYLKMEGHICDTASDLFQASRRISDNRYDCIILDIGLPDGNGMDIIKLLKENNSGDGILVLSARSSLDDKLSGLHLGADDYLTKPFHFAELSARIHSICRRKSFMGQNEIKFNEIIVNTETKIAYVGSTELVLTRKEFDLLVFLITNRDRIITKESIVEHLWGDHVTLTDSFDFVYTHVKNLRKKIISAGGKNYIRSLYGFGYKFSEE